MSIQLIYKYQGFLTLIFISFTLSAIAQSSKLSFSIGVESGFTSSWLTNGSSSHKEYIGDDIGNVYYTMRSKVPIGLTVGINYDLNNQFTLRYQYKYLYRKFLPILSDLDNTGDAPTFREGYTIGFLGFREGFFGVVVFSSSNILGLEYNFSALKYRPKYSFIGGIDLCLDDYEMGQRNEDTFIGVRGSYTNDSNPDLVYKGDIIENKITFDQNNPDRFGREVSILVHGAIKRNLKYGRNLKLELGYKWSVPSSRLPNNHLDNKLEYRHYEPDENGTIILKSTYNGDMRFPISLTGLYGNLTYSFRPFVKKDVHR